MNPSLWFVVPVHGRCALTAICLKQLARTCDQLQADGVDASAVVIGDLPNLRELRRRTEGLIAIHGIGGGRFGSYERNNQFTSRKFNDGIQAACDGRLNPRPADFVVPCGSDDWVDASIFRSLPDANTILAFSRLSFVREDGGEIVARELSNVAGCGIRVYPRELLRHLGYRPADEDRKRACDTSILRNLQSARPNLRIEYGDIDPHQIVDWKSPDEQLNPFDALRHFKSLDTGDPFDTLSDLFPAEALREMRAHYKRAARPMVAA